MRLHTIPRPLHPHLMRMGDQMATFRDTGYPLLSEVTFLDADLRKAVEWVVVHSVGSTPPGELPKNVKIAHLRIRHSHGEHDVRDQSVLIVREMIQVDAHVCVDPVFARLDD